MALGVEYHTPYAHFGITEQYRNGLDTEEYGTRIYSRIPLHKYQSAQYRHARKLLQPVIRQRGVVLSAKEIDCSGGGQSKSMNGTTYCYYASSDAAYLRSAALSDIASTAVQKQISNADIVSSNSPHIIKRGLHVIDKVMAFDTPELVIDSGTMLVFGPNAGIITYPQTKVTMGSSAGSSVYLIPKGLFAASLPGHATALKKQLSSFANPSFTSADTAGKHTNIGLLMLGQSKMDITTDAFASLPLKESFALEPTGPQGGTAKLKLASSARDTGYVTIGGNKDTSTYSKITNANFVGTPLRAIATNLTMDTVQLKPANGSAFTAFGGQVYAKDINLIATANTRSLVNSLAGNLLVIRDAVFDLDQGSANTTALTVRHFGKSNQISEVTSVNVLDSLFKGKSGTAGKATSAFISLPASPFNTDQGSGYNLSLINNTFQSRGTSTTALDPEADATQASITSIASIKAATTFYNANTDIPATNAGSMTFFGNTIVFDTASFTLDTADRQDAMTQTLLGFGNVFTLTGNNNQSLFFTGGTSTSANPIGAFISAQTFANNSSNFPSTIASACWNGSGLCIDYSDKADTQLIMRALPLDDATFAQAQTSANTDALTVDASKRATLAATNAVTITDDFTFPAGSRTGSDVFNSTVLKGLRTDANLDSMNIDNTLLTALNTAISSS